MNTIYTVKLGGISTRTEDRVYALFVANLWAYQSQQNAVICYPGASQIVPPPKSSAVLPGQPVQVRPHQYGSAVEHNGNIYVIPLGNRSLKAAISIASAMNKQLVSERNAKS